VAPELPAVRCVAAGSRRGPAAARNAGWRAARGEIIAFTDDDCIPAAGWLRAGVGLFDRDARIVGVSGRIVMPLPPRPTDYELNATGLVRSEFVTANCFYRKEALEAVGGFDERFAIAWREDSDLFFMLLRHYGVRPGSPRFPANPDAVVYHPIRPARWGVSLKQQGRVYYNALLYKKHPQLYRERLAPVTPWHYYGITASLTAGALGALTGQPRLAAAGALGWMLLTARFLRRRLAGTSRDRRHVVEMAVTSALIPPLALYWRLRGAIKHRVLFL
jgi:GT2 family glycosyltransferase